MDPRELTTPTSAGGGRGFKGKPYFTFGTPVSIYTCLTNTDIEFTKTFYVLFSLCRDYSGILVWALK